MMTITATIITIFFAQLSTINIVQAGISEKSDSVVAENLIEAVNNIDIISLNILLAEGALVDTVDDAGNTPLMLAARIGNPRMISIILAHNPEINLRNSNGETALMIATKAGILPIVKELVSAGADIQLRSNNGFTANQIAQRYAHRSVVQFLNGRNIGSFSR